MGTVLTLVVSMYFFIVSNRLQFVFFVFIFLIPFLPKYIGFGVGGEGFALSLKKILLMILFMSFTLSLTQNWEYLSKRISLVYQQNKMLINILLLFFVLKVLSLSLNSRGITLYIMLIMDFLPSIFIFMLTISLINSEETINRLMKTIFYGYIIVLILVLLEFILKFPLLSIFASGQMDLARDYSVGLVRGDRYRVNGSFISPIPLGQYLVVLFPIIREYLNKNGYSLILKIFCYLFIIFAIYSTGSRSAILMFAVMLYIYFILKLYRGTQLTRFIGHVFNFIIISITFYFVFNYINDAITGFSGRFDLITDDEERSTVSRALQYVVMYEKMQEAPFFGFGRERNYLTVFADVSTIDNALFWKILEVGLVGITVYLLFFYTILKSALILYIKGHKNIYLTPLLISSILLILYHMLTVSQDNHIYIYIFSGLICVMKVLQHEGT